MKLIYQITILILALLQFEGSSFGQGLIIPTSSYVIANSGNLVVNKKWVDNGKFTHNGGYVIFNGTGAQSISGSSATAFNNVTIGSASVTTISSPGQSVKGILLCNDTLNAGGNVTLLSTTLQTALIDGSGTGQVLGTVTMQRHLDTSYGYKIISSAFNYATVSQVSTYINLLNSFPLFYKYVEDVNHTGWVTDTTATDTLAALSGYGGNFGSSFSSSTFSLHGVVNNGTLSRTLYNHNNTYTLGFNLIGNPYPSPVNWDAAGGWTKTNVDNAIYYYNTGDTNQYYGTYSSYIAGVSSDGRANNIIPAMQGFFVHVTAGSYPVTGSLAVNNTARVNNLSPLYHKSSGSEMPLLRLSAAFEQMGKPDPVVVYFNDVATKSFDNQLDAIKMMNTDEQTPNLYAMSDDAAHMSIYALPLTGDSVSVVPLGLSISGDGWVVFNGSDIERTPAGMHVYFTDVQAGISQDLQVTPRYRVKLAAGKYEHRFFLSLGPDHVLQGLLSGDACNLWSYGRTLYVDLFLLSGGAGDVTVRNLSGQLLLRQKLDGFGVHEIPAPWITGVYIVSFTSNGHINSKKIFIGNK